MPVDRGHRPQSITEALAGSIVRGRPFVCAPKYVNTLHISAASILLHEPLFIR